LILARIGNRTGWLLVEPDGVVYHLGDDRLGRVEPEDAVLVGLGAGTIGIGHRQLCLADAALPGQRRSNRRRPIDQRLADPLKISLAALQVKRPKRDKTRCRFRRLSHKPTFGIGISLP
jgi:hypothetical protein